MRIAKLAGLLLLIATHLMMGCKTCPSPKPVQHTIEESDLTTWPNKCEKAEDGTWTCPAKTLSWVYENMIDVYYDWEGAATALKFATKKADLIIEGKDAQLNQWWRKWYYTVPLGILIGGIVGVGISLGTR